MLMVTKLEHVLGTARARLLNGRRDLGWENALVIISRPSGVAFDRERLCLFYDINMEEIHLFQSGCK